ncbi:hypothetical protein HJG60_012142 [Phyllostomus discolor]|uniref:Uncharacterized protein n=1 Tax=Phyllostomus discolor TaxID=89673 RepID=A0A833ZJJ0_9CHIR|nr:hypothetical protein HJG60_012142 [Phyllostomus discolor]
MKRQQCSSPFWWILPFQGDFSAACCAMWWPFTHRASARIGVQPATALPTKFLSHRCDTFAVTQQQASERPARSRVPPHTRPPGWTVGSNSSPAGAGWRDHRGPGTTSGSASNSGSHHVCRYWLCWGLEPLQALHEGWGQLLPGSSCSC